MANTIGYRLGRKVGDWLEEHFPELTDSIMAAFHDKVIAEARDLRSESGENPEYDRALVELSMRILNMDSDNHRDYLTFVILKDVTEPNDWPRR